MSPGAEGRLRHVEALIARLDLGGAEAQLRELLAVEGGSAAGWNLLARLLLQSGRAAASLDAAREAARLEPALASHRYVAGRALSACGDLPAAIDSYLCAVALDPEDAALQVSLGVALRGAGRYVEAAAAQRRALAIDPRCHPARLNLARLLAQRPELLASVGRGRHIDESLRREVEDLVSRGDQFATAGQPAEALALYSKAGARVAHSAAIELRTGAALRDCGELEAGLVHFDIAARLETQWPPALEGAASIASRLGLAEQARGYLSRALRLRADAALTISAALALPAVPSSVESIAPIRDEYARALQACLDANLQVEDPLRIQSSQFYLAYHGAGDRELNSRLARLYRHACPDLDWTAPPAAGRRRGARIRVGFISKFLHSHSIGMTTRGLVKELGRDRFEVYVLNIPPVVEDEVARSIRAQADHALTVESSLEAARRQIAALELDVLFYQDIGMEPFGYCLAHARLAPVQCVSFGHPDTTGIPTIDYFVSNDRFEPTGAEQHYSERLFLLRELPTLAYYYRPDPVPEAQPLAAPGEHAYLCPQTLFKVHPAFDFVLADILLRDPAGRVLLIRNQCQAWSQQLAARFRRQVPEVADRISFIPAVDSRRFVGLLAGADVILDTMHFNGMNTTLEALSAGVPVVTLPTGFQRGRHTHGMYRAMELGDCVARDERDYAAIAVRIATEPGYGRSLRQRIQERSQVLYESRRVVTEFERFFETAVAQAEPH